MLLPLAGSLALAAAPIGNPVLHLDKALARVRKYERVKLESELSPRSASPAGVSELSNAEHPSADKTEGTVIYEAARRQPPPQPGRASFFKVGNYVL